MVVSNKNNKLTLLGVLICLIGATFYGYEFVLRATPGIMTHQLMAAYHVPAATIGFLSSYYYILYIPLQLPAGVLMDKYGPKLLLSFSVLFCTLGSFIMGQTDHLWLAYFSQLIIGAGSAFAFVGALKLAANWLPHDRFAMFAGFTTLLGMIGAIGTDVLLINMVHEMGWRNVWYFLGGLGIIISLAIFFIVYDAPKRQGFSSKQRIRAKQREHKGWSDFWHAMNRIMALPEFWQNAFIGGVLFLPITVLGTLWGIPYLVDAHHLSHQQAGIASAMIFLGMGIGAPTAGWFSECIHNRMLLIRFSCFFAMLMTTGLLFVTSDNYLIYAAVFFGLGLSLGPQVLVFANATDMTENQYAGTAVATTNFSLMILSFITQPLVGLILDWVWDGTQQRDGTELFLHSDYQVALSVLPVLCALALVTSLFLKNVTSDH